MFESIRSWLFVPGDNARMIAKGLASEADAVILDLEDAVAPDNRTTARSVVTEALAQPRLKPVAVRINGLDSADALRDLAAVVRGGPDAIMLPKCAGLAQVVQLGHYLDALEAREGLEAGRIRILAISTETAAAVLAGSDLAAGHPRLAALLWGGEDLAASLGAVANRDEAGRYTAPYIAARTSCLYAAAASGAVAMDAVYVDFRDDAGLRAEARAALRDGFTCKAAIHPAQAKVINEVFTPDAEMIAEAEAIVAALKDGRAVAVLNGRLVEAPHLKKAQKILARSVR